MGIGEDTNRRRTWTRRGRHKWTKSELWNTFQCTFEFAFEWVHRSASWYGPYARSWTDAWWWCGWTNAWGWAYAWRTETVIVATVNTWCKWYRWRRLTWRQWAECKHTWVGWSWWSC